MKIRQLAIGFLLLASMFFVFPIDSAFAVTPQILHAAGYTCDIGGPGVTSCGGSLMVANVGDVIIAAIDACACNTAGAIISGITLSGPVSGITLDGSLDSNYFTSGANHYYQSVYMVSGTATAMGAQTFTFNWSTGMQTSDVEFYDAVGVPVAPAVSQLGQCINPNNCSNTIATPSQVIAANFEIEVGTYIASQAIGAASTGYTKVAGTATQTAGQYSTSASSVTSPTTFPINTSAACGVGCSWAALGTVFGFSPIGFFDCVITNMDAGNYLLPNGKVYDFRCTIQSSAIAGTNNIITNVTMRFNDSVHKIVVQYGNSTGFTGFKINTGSLYVQIASGKATSSLIGPVRQLVVDFKLSLSTSIVDCVNRGIELYAADSGGNTRGFEYVQTNYFNILNSGGSVNTLKSGNCARPVGFDIYDVSCKFQASPKSWMAVNSTWYQLQHYAAEFSIKLSCPVRPSCTVQPYGASSGDQFLWSTKAGAVPYTNPGDWKVRFGLYHFDNVSWVKGINVQIQLKVGTQDTNNEWTDLSIAWFSGNSLIRNDTINNWIQPSPLGQESFWVDLWYSNNNASTSEGGRIGSYYTGMHNTGFLWWTSWSPKLQNNTDSQIFVPLKDHTGKVMPVQSAQFSKVFMNMSRPFNATHTGGYGNFNATTRQFKSQEFTRVMTGPMAAITTPLFISAIVPQIQNTGFLTPLINAINYLAQLFINGLVGLGNILWAGLGSRFPWFTSAFGTFGNLVVNFASLLGNIAGYLSNILVFLGSAFGPVTTLVGVIGSAWATIQGIYLPIFTGANLSAMITLVVLWVFSGYIIEAAEKNDGGAYLKLVTSAWHITQTLLFWTWAFAKVLIDTIEGLIP